MLSYVEFYRPSYFLLENVVGLLQFPLMGRMVGRSFVEGIKMGVVKFIVRSLTCLGFACYYTPLYMQLQLCLFLFIDIKSDLRSCRPGIMVLLRAGSEYCSGERNADYLCPSSPCPDIFSLRRRGIIPFRLARNYLLRHVQRTLKTYTSTRRCTLSRSTTQRGIL